MEREKGSQGEGKMDKSVGRIGCQGHLHVSSSSRYLQFALCKLFSNIQ